MDFRSAVIATWLRGEPALDPHRENFASLVSLWESACRQLDLGESLSGFMEDLGLQMTGGDHGTVGRFREQMRRLFGAKIGMIWKRPGREKRRAALVADALS